MQNQLQTLGRKGKNAASSQVTELRKQHVLANMYNQTLPGQTAPINTVKTRGTTTSAEVRAFRSNLNVFSQITSGN